MSTTRWALYAFCATAVGTAAPSGAAAQGKQEIECSSNDGKRAHCEIPNVDTATVRMRTKLSQASCYRGKNWGVDETGVWVKDGCRARFSYVSKGRTPSGAVGTIECSSSDGKRKNCAVPNLDAKSVTVASKLSQAACDRGGSWDADSAGIWVSQGCRARFAFQRRTVPPPKPVAK